MSASEWSVDLVTLGPVRPHPNADRLELTQVHGYTVVLEKGRWREGDKAVYVPVDSIVPDRPEWDWLDGHFRIKAKRLRGVFSEGLVTAVPPGGVASMGITKHEDRAPVEIERPVKRGLASPKPPFKFPIYGLEALKRNTYLINPGDPVVITEKLHGCNARFCLHKGKLWVGSHRVVLRDPRAKPTAWTRFKPWLGLRVPPPAPDNVFWQAARRLNLPPGLVWYGEVFGEGVQDLHYGTKLSVRLFDAFDPAASRWLEWGELSVHATAYGLPLVPVLFSGPWTPELAALAEGKTTLGADHIREGIVIRKLGERPLKLVGEGYRLR